MSVNGISGGSANLFAWLRQDLQSLASTANTTSSSQTPSTSTSGNTQTSQSTGSQTTQDSTSALGTKIKTDLSTLLSDVQKGDLTGAQNALSALGSDFGSNGQSSESGTGTPQVHHHHHHHGGSGSSPAADAAAADSANK